MTDQLTSSLDQLQTSGQLRRDLVANVSHDLRSPITSVRGYAETLDTDPLLNSEALRGAILQRTNRLTKRINELFELSKLEAKERQTQPEPFLLGNLLTQTYTHFHLITQQIRIAFTRVDCEAPSVCYADIDTIEHVLQNLVENALHYSSESGLVRPQLTSPANAPFVTVSVSNSVSSLSKDTLAYLASINQFSRSGGSVRPPNSGWA